MRRQNAANTNNAGVTVVDRFPLTITINGPPRSKKNGARIVTRPFPKLLPSAAWCEWRDTCSFVYVGEQDTWGDATCNCAAAFYVDSMRRIDANNLYSGLADLLQHHGVVTDDACIIAWDGSRVYLDRDNPRVVLTLTSMAPTLVDVPKRKRLKAKA